MSPTPAISPEVENASNTLSDARIDERTSLKFFRNFWDTYKGHVRGLLAGVAMGSLAGAAVGLAVSAFIPAAVIVSLGGAVGVTGLTTSLIAPLFAAAGSLIGAKAFGEIGASSASRASGLAEKHARMLDPTYKGNALAAINDKLMYDGSGHHYEFPRTRDKGKVFSFKSGAVGGTIGAASGGLLGWVGAGFIGKLAVFKTLMDLPLLAGAGTLGVALGPVALGAITVGIFGLTFGVERSVFKTIFNHTDGNIKGRLFGSREPDLGRLQTLGKESDAQLLGHRLKRQEEIQYLEKNYNNKIFWGAFDGLFRGFVGGAATGALIGAASGLVALGVIALAGVSTVGLIVPLIVLFSGAGAMLGMEVFSGAGREAGAESTARAIDNEFEHNQTLRSQGITPQVNAPAKKSWFNPKAAITMGLTGAAIGIPLAPVMGFVGSATAAGYGISAAAGYVTSALTTGLVGAGLGLGTPVWKSIGNVTNWIYEKSYFNNDTSQEIAQAVSAPAVARSAQVTAPVAFKSGTINTLASPIGSYAGKPAGQHLRNLAEQQFKNIQSSQGATIN